MDFHGIDLNLLAAFDALMQERNVTRAAARMDVSQPAMSAALARLRALFGDRLFQRSATGLLPTPRAYDMAEPVARALREFESVLAQPERFDPGAAVLRFAIGLSDYPAFIVLPALLGMLAREAPGVGVDVRTFSGRDDAVELLDAGKIDLAIGVAPTVQESRILSRPIMHDVFVTLVRRDAAQARRKLDLDAYLAMNHILVSPEGSRYGVVDQALADHGLQRRVKVTMPQMFAVPALLREADLAATLLRRVALHSAQAAELVMFPPPVPLPEVVFHQIWHRRNDEKLSQRWLRDAVDRVTAGFR
ncbi:LysR substrate-binding domain-containing protein [Massilia sp. G4R7]|uniref:LysR substrate-binding domain-containing protein n=1 Tax=Massilia phyllostachyos TaxID=2898585 RepID=A0ABS8QB94_9BURK|nr:LysR family transcriptional regulator [Massilia phyllostachyos]MCD2518859.1 LysR substrate-binding domain-containing protein [Massilia phyllostachyos]